MQKNKIEKLKALNIGKGGLFENLIYRHFSTRITVLLVQTKITPNMVTFFSLLLAFVASIFYFEGSYLSLLIGTIIFNFSYTLDCVDGELARYKGLQSKFGAWWDAVGDRISEYVVFVSLTLGLYFKTFDVIVLVLGIFALTNSMLIANIRSLNKIHFDPKANHELRFGKRNYLASVDTFVIIVTITTLLNNVYLFLWSYTVLGAAVWIRQLYRSIKKYKNR